MLKKINQIKNLGVFKDFNWDASEICQLQKRNLFYGWNYSGKTTFTRIFRVLEGMTLDYDYVGARFSVEDYGGNKTNQNNLETFIDEVRVFSTDFIKDNLKWEGQLAPIFILGKQNIELQNEYVKLGALVNDNLGKKEKLQENNSTKESEISTGKTNIGRHVKRSLNIAATFDTRNVQSVLDSQNKQFKNYILNDEQFKIQNNRYHSTEQRELLNRITVPSNIKDSVLQSKVATILTKTVPKQVEHQLDKDPKLFSWVKNGLMLHEGKTICEFCGNEITEERWTYLKCIFSEQSELLINEINVFKDEIQSYLFDIDIHYREKFFEELQDDYLKVSEDYLNEKKRREKHLEQMSDILDEKKTKIFEEVKYDNLLINDTIHEKAKLLNELIEKNNDKLAGRHNEKEKAKTMLIDHYIAQYAIESNLSKKGEELEGIKISIKEIDDKLVKLSARIEDIEREISDEVKGAEKINEILMLYFGKDDIRIIVTDDKKYQLSREGYIARNLSEGEKTAIAFSYFIAKLNEKDFDIRNSIIVIDDPVSSLDSNHLYNTFAIIKNRMKKAKQLFLLTHNYEFFKMLRDDRFFREYKDTSNKIASYYFVKRISKTESVVQNLPNALKKYNSEYHYLFCSLYRYANSNSEEDMLTYSIPNMTRKLLEIFTSFKIPNTKITLDNRLMELCSSEDIAVRIYKFINHVSHSDSITFSIEFPTVVECKEILRLALKLIEDTDGDHYRGMKDLACKKK